MFPFGSKNKKPSNLQLTPEQDKFLATCTREYNEKLEKLNREWSFSDYKTWGFDQNSGLFFLQLHDSSRVEADGQVFGSYLPERNSWEWAWNNPNVEAGMKRDVQLVKAFGEKEKIEYLCKGMVPATDKLIPIYLSAIAVKVTDSEDNPLFAGNAGTMQVFIGLKNLRKKPA